ncbi:hypothetical protein [Corallococcus sp. EGB]|uniref:hypothetical protein n=1 Tax=Corallococcus sp. EGB TaxID=1521117 RepID=UPI001CC07284|nr:hypothetical protein [Corallococcus sp. EGB]
MRLVLAGVLAARTTPRATSKASTSDAYGMWRSRGYGWLLVKPLPNVWPVRLSNEHYADAWGQDFEARGLPPRRPLDVFGDGKDLWHSHARNPCAGGFTGTRGGETRAMGSRWSVTPRLSGRADLPLHRKPPAPSRGARPAKRSGTKKTRPPAAAHRATTRQRTSSTARKTAARKRTKKS